MKIISDWFNNHIKNLFRNPCKNLVCAFVAYTAKNNYNRKHIDFITRAYNTLSRRTKFKFLDSFVKTYSEHGMLAYLAQDCFFASRPQFFYQNFLPTRIKSCNSFVLRLSSAKIIGSSNVILLRSGDALYEPIVHDEENRWDYTDTSIYKCLDQGFILKYRDSRESIQSGIMISGNYSWNYYHFIYEFLSKFLLVDKLNLPSDVPIIVDEVVKIIPQYQELLRHFNSNNRELIFIKSGCSYDVETLYYPSLLNIIPPNFKDINSIKFFDCLFNLSSITFLRKTLLPRMGQTKSNKKIFLSRKNATSRRRYNESEVIDIFKKHDFQIVCPENYSIADQMHLFNNAGFIAGVTGAAFTNILFCSPGCKILCINSYQNELSIFSSIAKHSGLDLQYLSANEDQRHVQSLHDEFVINPAKLENVLVDFLSR